MCVLFVCVDNCVSRAQFLNNVLFVPVCVFVSVCSRRHVSLWLHVFANTCT